MSDGQNLYSFVDFAEEQVVRIPMQNRFAEIGRDRWKLQGIAPDSRLSQREFIEEADCGVMALSPIPLESLVDFVFCF